MKREAQFNFSSCLWRCGTWLSSPPWHVVFCCLFCRKWVRRWEVQRERSWMRTSLRWKRQGWALTFVLHSDLVHNDELSQCWPTRGVCTSTNKCVAMQSWWRGLHELNTDTLVKYESLGLTTFKIQHLLLLWQQNKMSGVSRLKHRKKKLT